MKVLITGEIEIVNHGSCEFLLWHKTRFWSFWSELSLPWKHAAWMSCVGKQLYWHYLVGGFKDLFIFHNIWDHQSFPLTFIFFRGLMLGIVYQAVIYHHLRSSPYWFCRWSSLWELLHGCLRLFRKLRAATAAELRGTSSCGKFGDGTETRRFP